MIPEFLTKKPTANGVISFVTGLLILLIAIGSFALSYSNLHQTALAYGVDSSLAAIWPLLIDFALIVFSLAVVRASLYQERTWWPWLMVALYTVGTVSFNILHAPANLTAQVVAVVAPLSLFLSFETLMAMLKNGVKRSNVVQSLADLAQQLTQKTQELANFEAKTRAEIEKEGQQAKQKWSEEVLALARQAENKHIELVNLEAEHSQRISQLQEQVETMERTIQSYQSDIEAKQKELKSLDSSSQIQAYMPANLSPEQRQELVSRMGKDGLTQEQMAKLLGVSVGTIKNIKKASEVATNGRVTQ